MILVNLEDLSMGLCPKSIKEVVLNQRCLLEITGIAIIEKTDNDKC